MAISLSVLSVACFIGAAISFLRYDSKYFDLLVLSGVIFLGTAMPSFEVDASLEELKSINHNLVNIQIAIEIPATEIDGLSNRLCDAREHRIIALWCWRRSRQSR